MDKTYNHLAHEKEIYNLWEKSGAFSPRQARDLRPFTIIMPPPNASDPLHIGHARFITIEDVLIRYHRMKGEPTLWLPGADHAGIETQYVFERRLAKEGKSRFDYDQETLYKMIWNYVMENKEVMEKQLRELGASCDFTRNKFTLDPEITKIVYKTFKKLYEDGLVYRGERIVNYCPRCGTAFSQLEIDYLEREDNLYYLDYGTLVVATTRPETIFADVAVAVNPKDKRYEKLIGTKAKIPIINREVPIIADNLVDITFGTGALKITPGHDALDFEIGQKHALPVICVIDNRGKITSAPQKYVGIKAGVAREEVVKDLEQAGKIKKVEKLKHSVAVCYRDKGLIEPMVSKQWFIKVEPLAKRALSAINKGEVRFISLRFEKIAKHWLKNLKDWNISRQIVWGIRIPAWRCDRCLAWTVTAGETPEKCTACGQTKLTRDTDTFDTWFSSGQWPFATLQTTKPGDFEYFYPTSVMETGYDILPFWVIRMIMLGLYVTNKVPFYEVLLHGLVRDKEGQKISKSKGNVIDPIEMAKKYGADALRMGLIWGALVENDISLSEDNIRGQRNFANKIWNIARFVLMEEKGKRVKRNEDDALIVKELKTSTKKVTRLLDKYRLNEAAEEIYDFIWHKFADVYIEKAKERRPFAQKTLEYVLQESLKLLHPFMPFVTEKIWSLGFARDKQDLLINASWPKG
ncbi:valine--tRNA ligase [Candidatus Woesebacteria bacterium]|nr:valine--tRNA ligase [Candidatus Woesebacteria bacterium]